MKRSSFYTDGRDRFRQQCLGLLARLRRNEWLSRPAPWQTPLLNSADLQQLHAAAVSPHTKPLLSSHQVDTLLVGERSSAFAGSGYEFAENQLYIRGDDSRFINWRLLAKTGKLYRKVFHEERRPQFWVVVDKRSSMRFATRKQLKVTQAARHALFYLYQAQQQKLACGGVCLDEQVEWFKPAHSLNTLQPLVQKIIAPAPPRFKQDDSYSLNVTLKQLINRIPAGSIILLISDFYGLSNDTLATLYTLTSRHTVIAKHVVDPSELELAATIPLQVAADREAEAVRLDTSNPAFSQQYRQAMQQQRDNIEKQLTASGVEYHCCRTDEELISEVAR